ncbi:MAG: MauE/DoxX family redox-associated membrane protein [Ilumatobacteraceae bacterium]
MRILAAVAAIGVGTALIVAGVFKLVDVPAWRIQAAELGAPPGAAVLVPWTELSLGVLLVVPVLRPWPAVAAVVLLTSFTVIVVRRLLDGARPPCACFGSRSNRPLGPRHLVRNALLIALGVVAAFGE